MFKSISLATPNSTVTAQFTASEACQVGVPANSTVRKNSTVTTDNPVVLAVGDKIELDVTSGPGNGSVFIPWTYNGNACYFGVASAAVSSRPVLKSTSRGKTWNDIGGSTLFSYKAGSSENPLSLNGTTSGTQTTDLVPVIKPENRTLYFIRSDGAQVYQTTYPSQPLSHTYMWNGAASRYDSYVLCVDGFIYAGLSMTRSTNTIPGAKTLWSDGYNLYLGGVNKIFRMSDINTVAQTYTTTETVIYGVALAGTALAVTDAGKIVKLEGNGTLTALYTSTSVGEPTVFQNQMVFPICEEFKLRVFKADGTFVKDVTTGDLIPWSAGASMRNDLLVVSGVDTQDVLVYTDLNTNPTTKTFTYRVCYAIPVGGNLVASHYLRATNLAVPPNPVVSGINFPAWRAPINVDTGSGEANVVTEAETLPVSVAPNAQLLVNGIPATTWLTQNRVQLITRSLTGRSSTAMVIGNYAFDFVVTGMASSSFTTNLAVDNKFLMSQVVFNFTIPARAVNAPIAVSHGTMLLNGNPYNGSTLVSAGDNITVTINVPSTLTKYWSVVSIADSQFALTIAGAVTRIADTERFQDYSSLDTVSTIVVDEDGTYYLPNYTDAKVFKDDVQLTFPVDLLANDQLVVHHIKTSSWWLDPRDTILLGPSINYICRSLTTVDDTPDYIDFGRVHMGIPDFDFPTDQLGTISGLSDDFSVQIYNEYMTFSVNGGDVVAKPFVKNGDVVKAIYNVKNLFETMWAKVDLMTGDVYEFGEVNIDPALGEWMPARPSQGWGEYQWQFVPDHIELMDANISEVQQTPEKTMEANTPEIQVEQAPVGIASIGLWQESKQLPGQASIGLWQSNPQLPGLASIGLWQSNPQLPGAASVGQWQSNPQLPGQASIGKAVAGSTITGKPISIGFYPAKVTVQWGKQKGTQEDEETAIRLATTTVLHEPAFGYPATFTKFAPTFHHEASMYPRKATTFFFYQEGKSARYKDPVWTYMAEKPPRWKIISPFYWQINSYTWYNPGWRYMSRPGFRYKNQIPNWVNGATITGKVMDHVIVPEKHIEKMTRSYTFMPEQRVEKNTIQSKAVVKSSLSKAATKSGVFVKSSIASKQQVAVKPKVITFAGKQGEGMVPSAHNWSYSDPLKVGGYQDEATAEAAALNYNNVLPLTVYKQPEGSFGYVFARDTSLVCDLKGTNLMATIWLIGGG